MINYKVSLLHESGNLFEFVYKNKESADKLNDSMWKNLTSTVGVKYEGIILDLGKFHALQITEFEVAVNEKENSPS